jgi:hypothetical protein
MQIWFETGWIWGKTLDIEAFWSPVHLECVEYHTWIVFPRGIIGAVANPAGKRALFAQIIGEKSYEVRFFS